MLTEHQELLLFCHKPGSLCSFSAAAIALDLQSKSILEMMITLDNTVIDAKDEMGRTLLIQAVEERLRNQKHHIETFESNMKKVKLLLSFHPDIHWQDQTGKTALHHAIEQNDAEMMQLLLAHGASLEPDLNQEIKMISARL